MVDGQSSAPRLANSSAVLLAARMTGTQVLLENRRIGKGRQFLPYAPESGKRRERRGEVEDLLELHRPAKSL